jgi:hypothetical protein
MERDDLKIDQSSQMDQFYGQVVRLVALPLREDSKFSPYYYNKDEEYVYGWVVPSTEQI